MSTAGKGGYTRLNMEEDTEATATLPSRATPGNSFVQNAFQQQQATIANQDENLERIGNSLRTLKNVSHQIGDELEDQSEMLDELGTSMSNTEARMNDVMKKLAKLTRLEDESRQCTAIFVLSGLIFVLLIILVVF